MVKRIVKRAHLRIRLGELLFGEKAQSYWKSSDLNCFRNVSNQGVGRRKRDCHSAIKEGGSKLRRWCQGEEVMSGWRGDVTGRRWRQGKETISGLENHVRVRRWIQGEEMIWGWGGNVRVRRSWQDEMMSAGTRTLRRQLHVTWVQELILAGHLHMAIIQGWAAQMSKISANCLSPVRINIGDG